MQRETCFRDFEAVGVVLGCTLLGFAFWMITERSGWLAAIFGGFGAYLIVCAILSSIENAVDIMKEKKPDDKESNN